MKIIEACPREIGFVLWGHCQNLLDDPRIMTIRSVGQDFTIHEHGGYLGHVTCTIYIKFLPRFQRRLHTKFGFYWPSGIREENV